MTIERMYHSIRLLMIRSERGKAEYLKKHHIFGGIGENCQWGSWVIPLYPELIILHNNVSVHKTAHILTHDMINAFLLRGYPDTTFGSQEVLGPVEIHDNVYISMNAVIMPNVEIGPNCIISAGTVVSNDIAGNSLVAGNPAKIVGKFSSYVALRKMYASSNPKFANQHLPPEIAKETWERFRKKHSRK